MKTIKEWFMNAMKNHKALATVILSGAITIGHQVMTGVDTKNHKSEYIQNNKTQIYEKDTTKQIR